MALPFYREIRENRAFKRKDTGITVDVQVGDKIHVARYFEGRSSSGVQLFLIRCDEFFDRPGIYGERGKPYEDNAARFIFFCKAALELARRLTPQLQILHVHDWAAALVPVFVHAHGLPFSTVLTMHHVADQGSFWGLDFQLTNLPKPFFTLHGVEFFGRLNFLKGGILVLRPNHDSQRTLSARNSDARRRVWFGRRACARMRIGSAQFWTAQIMRAGIRLRIVFSRCGTMRDAFGRNRLVVRLCLRK